MDDFDRAVYCMLGLPFDAVDMGSAVERVKGAAKNGTRCFLSTPNLNFLIGCRNDPAFRDSVIHSDLSVADGMPLVWMARLLGVPLPERVAGSGLFECLRDASPSEETPMRVYFFGGPPGAAEAACAALNASPSGVRCVGWQSPGFESIGAMSGQARIEAINASQADFLVVALGARKGQGWIEHNLDRLEVPVVSHLGAVVNFVAGTVARAPVWMQRFGLEWLWRIKEEPGLWRRYLHDGLELFRLLFGVVLPYAAARSLVRRKSKGMEVTLARQGELSLVSISGMIADEVPPLLRNIFREAVKEGKPVVLDLTHTEYFGPGFVGLVLLLKKRLDELGLPLKISGASAFTRQLLRWNMADYLLAAD